MSRRRFIGGSLALGAASLLPGRVVAQSYPSKPVRLLVGYPPGGFPDTMARIVAPKLSEAFGQQFVIENRPGAGGALACEAAAKAAPDGYTLAVVDIGQSAINLALYPKLPYDTLRDFAPVSLLGTSPFFLAAHTSAGVSTYPELAAAAKARPGQFTYGSSGNGTPPHLAMEILKSRAGLDLVHVPFKGSGQSLPALIGGQVHLLFTVLPTLSAALKSGQVKLLALASDARTPQAPDVPTFAELGVKGVRILPSIGILAPVATPKPIVAALAKELAKTVHDPDTLKRFASMGIDPVGNTPEQYAASLKEDIAYYANAVKVSGAKID
jgi:tripartite-type tricarboxylate transporter receptor subunit TctC